MKKFLALVLLTLVSFVPQSSASTFTIQPLQGGRTVVTISWFAESFSTTITGTGVQMATPTAQKVCKWYPRIGNRCAVQVMGGPNYYTAFSGSYSAADFGQCQPTWYYVYNWGPYGTALPVNCAGSLGSGTGFLVSFQVVGSGTINLSDGTTVAIP